MEMDQPKLAKGRKVAILAAPGVQVADIAALQKRLKQESVLSEIIGPFLGTLEGDGGAG